MKLRIKVDLQTFEVEVGDLNSRPVLVRVDGNVFEVWPEEPAAPAAAGDGTRVAAAPIPGVVQSVSVEPGDQVNVGQELCVLEAMKMKNLIRASRAGRVAAVLVSPGDQVRHGQVLVEFTD